MTKPCTNRPQLGIGVLIFNKQNEILLGQRINAHGALTWAAPGGHLELDESFENCAMREVEEETGLIITPPTFYALTNDIFPHENKHYITIFMQATYPEHQELEVREPHKIIKWHWFSMNNLLTPLFLPLQNILNNKSYGLQERI